MIQPKHWGCFLLLVRTVIYLNMELFLGSLSNANIAQGWGAELVWDGMQYSHSDGSYSTLVKIMYKNRCETKKKTKNIDDSYILVNVFCWTLGAQDDTKRYSKEFVEDELYRRFLSVKHYCDFEWLDKENVHYREHDTVNEWLWVKGPKDIYQDSNVSDDSPIRVVYINFELPTGWPGTDVDVPALYERNNSQLPVTRECLKCLGRE